MNIAEADQDIDVAPQNQPTVPRNAEERAARVQAFRNQVRFSIALRQDMVETRWLGPNNWDVNLAVAAFWGAQQNPQPGSAACPSTVECDRLHLLHAVLKGIGSNPNQGLRANAAVIALVCHRSGWLPDTISQNIANRNGDYADVVTYLGRHRIALVGAPVQDERLARFIDITATNSWFSALQFLKLHKWDLPMAMDVWFRNGGLPIVYPPLPRGKHGVEKRKSGLRAICYNRPVHILPNAIEHSNLEEEKFDQNRAEPQIRFEVPLAEISTDPPLPSWTRVKPLPQRMQKPSHVQRLRDNRVIRNRDYLGGNLRGARGYVRGAVINSDRSRARLHCPDPSKLYFETIRNLKYDCQWFTGTERVKNATTNRYSSATFNWNDGATPSDDVAEFDWHNSSHILKLNKWRNNLNVHRTGKAVRAPVGDKMNKYERDWLREQEAMLTEERYATIKNKNGNEHARATFESPKKFPLSASQAESRRITDLFNETFANKSTYKKEIYRCNPGPPGTPGAMQFTVRTIDKDMSKVGMVPRPPRTIEVIRQHRLRDLNTAKHFMFSYANKGDRHMNEIPDESDSDFGQNGSVNGDDDADQVDPDDIANDGNHGNSRTLDSAAASAIYDLDPSNMDQDDWDRVIEVMGLFYGSTRGRSEQRTAHRLLNHVGVTHIGTAPLDLEVQAENEVMGELRMEYWQNARPAAPRKF
jgi:hypothetical protein